APLGPRAPGAWWSLVDVEFERGAAETYALPLLVCGDTRAPVGMLGHLEVEGVPGLVADALDEPSSCRALLAAIGEDLTVRSRRRVKPSRSRCSTASRPTAETAGAGRSATWPSCATSSRRGSGTNRSNPDVSGSWCATSRRAPSPACACSAASRAPCTQDSPG